MWTLIKHFQAFSMSERGGGGGRFKLISLNLSFSICLFALLTCRILAFLKLQTNEMYGARDQSYQ